MIEETYRKVNKLKWLELMCASKNIDLEFEKLFMKEVSIIVSLSHFNLVKYYFAMKDNVEKRSQSYVLINIKKYLYFEMELMQIILTKILEEKRIRNLHFSS